MSGVDDAFENLVADLRPATPDEVRAAVAEALGDGATLPDAVVAELTIRLGKSRATIHRIKTKILARRPPEPAPKDAFESLERYGAEGFYFDERMLVLYQILDCNQALLRQKLIEAGFPSVSPATICRRLAELPPRISDGVKYGHKNRYRFQLTRRVEAEGPYDQFQVDEFHLGIDILVPITRGEKLVDDEGNPIEVHQPDGPGGRRYKVVQPRLLLLIDAYSRYVLAWAVLYKKAATMHDTLALFADAFLRREVNGRMVGGAPDTIGTDNGGALVGSLVKAFLELVPANLDIALGYSPQTPSKAKVEANGRPIKKLLTVGLAGRRSQAQTFDGYDMGAVDSSLLLTSEQYTAHVRARIDEWNHERPHTSTGEVPFDRLTRDGVIGRRVEEKVLAACFLPNDMPRPDRLSKGGRRAVDKEGVRLHDGTYHQAIGFFDQIGNTVEVRTLHHNDDYAAAFTLGGKFIDFVKHPSVWTEDDDRERHALAREASLLINRVQKRARDFVAAAPASNPEDLQRAAVDLVVKDASVARAKGAKRDVARPDDVGPRRRKSTAAAKATAAAHTSDLYAAFAAMQDNDGRDVEPFDDGRNGQDDQ